MRYLTLYLPTSILIALACALPMSVSAFGASKLVEVYSHFSFSKTGPATVAPGGTITYTFTVNQTAEPPAGSQVGWVATVIDPLSADLTYISAVGPKGVTCTKSLSVVSCFLLYSFSERSKTFTINALVSSNAACGSVIKNQATLQYPALNQSPVQSTMNGEIVSTTVVCVGSSSSSFSSSIQSSSSSSAPVLGCIDVLKETYDTQSAILTPVTQFSFQLDGQRTAYNNGNGLARFENVTPGTHTVTETVPAGWTQLNVTPANGTVMVGAGSNCAVVTFKNKQVLPPASSSSSSSSSSPMTHYVHPQCSDGLDNDGDGRSDFFDPGCYPNNVFNPVAYDPNDNNETNAAVLCRWVRTNSQWMRSCI